MHGPTNVKLKKKIGVATVLFGVQDKQLQWSALMEIINIKKESKLHFEFPILCQNNLHSNEQRNSIIFI